MRSTISPKILLRKILIGLAVGIAVLYVGDYMVFRVRMMHAKPDSPLETLKTLRVLAIPEKNGKISYEIDQVNPEQTVTCAHSIFPHAGSSPCWYVKPRINQPIPM